MSKRQKSNVTADLKDSFRAFLKEEQKEERASNSKRKNFTDSFLGSIALKDNKEEIVNNPERYTDHLAALYEKIFGMPFGKHVMAYYNKNDLLCLTAAAMIVYDASAARRTIRNFERKHKLYFESVPLREAGRIAAIWLLPEEYVEYAMILRVLRAASRDERLKEELRGELENKFDDNFSVISPLRIKVLDIPVSLSCPAVAGILFELFLEKYLEIPDYGVNESIAHYGAAMEARSHGLLCDNFATVTDKEENEQLLKKHPEWIEKAEMSEKSIERLIEKLDAEYIRIRDAKQEPTEENKEIRKKVKEQIESTEQELMASRTKIASLTKKIAFLEKKLEAIDNVQQETEAIPEVASIETASAESDNTDTVDEEVGFDISWSKEQEKLLRDARIVVVGGHEKFIRILKNKYPKWTYLSDEQEVCDKGNATIAFAEHVFVVTTNLCHGAFYGVRNITAKKSVPFTATRTRNVGKFEQLVYYTLVKNGKDKEENNVKVCAQ